MLSRKNLRSYQLRAVDKILHNRKFALWLDMGLGKTASSLTALSDLLDIGEVKRPLILAPLRVATTVWEQEASKWRHLTYLRPKFVNLANKTVKARNALLMRPVNNAYGRIHIINHDLLWWLVDFWGAEDWPYDMVIVDESDAYKSSSSKRFKKFRKVSKRTERIVELTGTPASNGLLDLWAQMYLLDGGERLGFTNAQYKARYFESDYMGYKWAPREGAEEKIYDKLSDIVLSMSSEDYLNLPERIDVTDHVEIPPRAMKDYKTLEKDFILALQEGDVEVFNAAALTNKLLQFANGAVYYEGGKDFEEVHAGKLNALEEIVEHTHGPILVAYNYKSDLARLKAKFPFAEELGKGDEMVRKWNNGDVRMLLTHPASAGHGLNLQYGGSNVVWFGLNWSLGLYKQFNARLYRQGQTLPVTVRHIVAKGTVDEVVLATLADKGETQGALLTALKDHYLPKED